VADPGASDAQLTLPRVPTDHPADTGARDRGLFTIPNLISLVRLACVPLFCWLLFDADERGWAFGLLGALGASDWIDGWIARHFDQTSVVGKVLDPTADRILLLTVAAALMVDGAVPTWFGVAVLVREAIISVAVLALAAAGARRIDVQWVGKTATLSLMFAFPAFLLADQLSGAGHDATLAVAWTFAAIGLTLSYYAAAMYVPLARRALREGRGGQEALT